jgi:hypothetical protein
VSAVADWVVHRTRSSAPLSCNCASRGQAARAAIARWASAVDTPRNQGRAARPRKKPGEGSRTWRFAYFPEAFPLVASACSRNFRSISKTSGACC